MNCYQIETLKQYVAQKCGAEEEQIEQHLYSCDVCLEKYMAIIDEQANSMPFLIDNNHFTEQVFKKIDSREQAKRKRRNESALVHYFIAASFTLLLMFSGVFQTLTNWISEDAMNPDKSGSFSNEMLHKTVEMIDTMSKNKKEAQ